jgi:hypothetical protein
MVGRSRTIAEHMELGLRVSNNRGYKILVVIIHRHLRKYRLALGIIKSDTRRIAENMAYG